MPEKKWLIPLIALVLLTSLAFSVQWLLPTAYECAHPRSGYKFVPLRYAANVIERDTYYYYSYVREIIDNGPLSGDPLTYENKGKRTISYSYIGSLFLGSIGGMVTGRTEHAYYFNTIVFPAASFLLLFLLFRTITGFTYGSMLLAVMTVMARAEVVNFTGLSAFFQALTAIPNGNLLDVNDLARMPNILVTNVHLLSFVLLLLKRGKGPKTRAAMLLVLACSPLISVQNTFTVSYIVAFMLVKSVLRREDRAELLTWLAGLAVLVPGLTYLYEINSKLQVLNIPFSGADPAYYAKIHWGFLALHTGLLVAAAAYWVRSKAPLKKECLALIAALLACPIVLSALSGGFAALEAFRRGYLMLYWLIVLSAAALSLKQVLARIPAIMERLRPAAPALAVACALCLVTWSCTNQVKVYAAKTPFYNAPQFYELCEWSRHNTTGKDVALTLDYDLLINMPIYSPLNFYLPQTVLSPTSSDERYDRFIELARLYGIDRERLKDLLKSMKSINLEPDEGNRYEVLMNLVLFYRRYIDRAITDNEIANMVSRLDSPAGPVSLKGRADYLILSGYDMGLIQDGSPLKVRLPNLTQVFGNGRYKVFRLDNRS